MEWLHFVPFDVYRDSIWVSDLGGGFRSLLLCGDATYDSDEMAWQIERYGNSVYSK